ncbi:MULTISPECIES: hypothetical protein [unclassified Moorena]|nr:MULTISPECIES: hypothetical protein [unclassified Moorena]
MGRWGDREMGRWGDGEMKLMFSANFQNWYRVDHTYELQSIF